MQHATAMREVLAEYARSYPCGLQTIYLNIDNKRSISYNGRHYTLFLPQDDPVPSFQDAHVLQLGIGNTHVRSSWIVPYDFNAHVLRQQKKKQLSARVMHGYGEV